MTCGSWICKSSRAEIIAVQVAEWQPDAVALSCNYLANVPEVIELAKAAAAVAAGGICVCRRP